MKNTGLRPWRVAGLAILTMVLAEAGAKDLSVGTSRDVMFQPSRVDSVVEPTSVFLGVGFPLGRLAVLRVRAGYSGYVDRAVDHSELFDERVTLNGLRVQVEPILRVRTPIDSVSFYGGVGLGGRGQVLQSYYRDDRERRRDQSTLAIDQSFLFGIGFELSRRFGFDLEFERQGFCASYEVTKEYYWYEGFTEPIQGGSTDNLNIGWRKSAPAGLGVGLRLKL